MALQELTETGPSPAALAAELGYRCLWARSRRRSDGRWQANALLSRHAVEALPPRRLDVFGAEPRGALALRLPAQDLTLVATHLGLAPHGRVGQLRRLCHWLGDPPRRCVLLGDLNAYGPGVLGLGPLADRLPKGGRIRSYPALRPRLALDAILASRDLHLTALRAWTRPPAPEASDHLPVVAELI